LGMQRSRAAMILPFRFLCKILDQPSSKPAASNLNKR
jgi:hypothetical protein